MSSHDAREQYFLELVNRARMNPAGEAAKYGITLNKDLAAGTINATPKQVLAGNSYLNNSATAHSQWMLDNDIFSHTGSGSSTPWVRITSAGYSSYSTAGENIAYNGSSFLDANASIALHHRMLFESAGHRKNILNDGFEELGIGSVVGDYNGLDALMSTQNFGTKGSGLFITGVAYVDSYNNNFYSIGEGRGGIKVTLLKFGIEKLSQTTPSAGGYAMKTTLTGVVDVEFSGGAITGKVGARLTLGTSNIKVDVVDNNSIELNFSATLTASAKNAKLLGIESKNLTGNAFDNRLEGNVALNTMNGSSGNDTLIGRQGADKLSGGIGLDKFHYGSTSEGGDTISDFANGDHFTFFSSAFGGLAKGDLNASAFRLGSTAADSNDRFIYNSTTDTLWYDSNGNNSGGMVKIALLANGFTLDAGDILIV